MAMVEYDTDTRNGDQIPDPPVKGLALESTFKYLFLAALSHPLTSHPTSAVAFVVL